MPSPDEVTYSQVQGWIDDGIFDEVEQETDRVADYNFRMSLKGSGLNVHAVKNRNESAVRLVSQMPIPAGVMANLLELDYERNDLRIHLEHVLTAVPGYYEYLDESEEPTDFASARVIRVTHRVYPDGGSQQVFMDSVMDILNAMNFIRDAINTTAENIDEKT